MAETPYIFNIQKFSTHDGDGVRTTIFFKGCPLKNSELEIWLYH